MKVPSYQISLLFSYIRKSIQFFIKSGPKIISDEKLENINSINVEGSCGFVAFFLFPKRKQGIIIKHKVIFPQFQGIKRNFFHCNDFNIVLG
jgi:hypothetical protein